jgi:RNA polymerase sigma-70 factor (ECF subfamily)
MTVDLVDFPAPDAEEFDLFYRLFRHRVYRLVARHFPACDPDDVAQETMTRCFVKFAELDRYRDAWPWVSFIARNVAIDSMRRQGRVVSTDELPEPPGGDADATYDAVVVSERRRTVHRALGQLSATDRALVEDHYIHGVSYADLAAVRDMKANALRQRLFRARAFLADELQRLGGAFGVVPVAIQVRLARLSRRLQDVSQQAGPVGASALSVAAVAGVATVATMLATPAATPAPVALPAAEAGPAVARAAARPDVARPARAVRGATGTRQRRTAPRPPAHVAAAPAPTDLIAPEIRTWGSPTNPQERQGQSIRIPTPTGDDVVVEREFGWLPGQGVLCWAEVTTCEERQQSHG